MKRHSLFVHICAGCFFIACLFGCKSVQSVTPEETPASDVETQALKEVDPVYVIGSDGAVYFHIPVKQNKDFVKSLFQSAVNDISESDAQKIVDRIDIVYAVLGSDTDKNRLQVSASGSFPMTAIKFVMTQKNGWISHGNPVQFYTRSGTDFQVAIPASSKLLVAKDVQPMVDIFKGITDGVIAAEKPWPDTDIEYWMEDNTSDIRFCVLRPQAFLAGLLGMDMRLALSRVKGKLVEADENTMYLTLVMQFQNALVIKAAQSMMKLAYGNSVTITADEANSTVQVEGIVVSKVKLLDLVLKNQ
ncbi:MAG: hypothetical protein K6E51_11885 [Treponema sp.]|nr:hypothetical protein [Treponema sp.]